MPPPRRRRSWLEIGMLGCSLLATSTTKAGPQTARRPATHDAHHHRSHRRPQQHNRPDSTALLAGSTASPDRKIIARIALPRRRLKEVEAHLHAAIGEWGECSATTCTQSRPVMCETRDSKIVPGHLCGEELPEAERACPAAECDAATAKAHAKGVPVPVEAGPDRDEPMQEGGVGDATGVTPPEKLTVVKEEVFPLQQARGDGKAIGHSVTTPVGQNENLKDDNTQEGTSDQRPTYSSRNGNNPGRVDEANTASNSSSHATRGIAKYDRTSGAASGRSRSKHTGGTRTKSHRESPSSSRGSKQENRDVDDRVGASTGEDAGARTDESVSKVDDSGYRGPAELSSKAVETRGSTSALPPQDRSTPKSEPVSPSGTPNLAAHQGMDRVGGGPSNDRTHHRFWTVLTIGAGAVGSFLAVVVFAVGQYRKEQHRLRGIMALNDFPQDNYINPFARQLAEDERSAFHL